MKSDFSAESWLKFFTSAGIPMDSARTYAVTFSKNEIHLDMLSEIKKEYLVDMGITLMGHIIAILRHAKAVYEENVTKTTLPNTVQKSAPVVKGVPKEKPVLKTLPLRISSEKVDASTTVAVNNSNQRAVGTSMIHTNNLMYGPHPKTSTTSLQVSEKELQQTRKKDNENLIQKTKMSTIAINNMIPKKKTTVDSLQQRQNDIVSSSTNNKGKVFERLGDEVAESTSDSPVSKLNNESVFSRLGGKTTDSVNSGTVKVSYKSMNSDVESTIESSPSVKRTIVQNGNKSKVKTIMFTMRADEAEAQSQNRGRKRSRSPPSIERTHVKARLGRASRSVSPSPRRIVPSNEDVPVSTRLREFGGFRSDQIKPKLMQSLLDSDLEESSLLNKGSILRSSPVESIGLSGLHKGKPTGNIKSRLGRATSITKTTNQKKVSFGTVSQQLIPLEMKPAFRQFRRMRYTPDEDDFYTDYEPITYITAKSQKRFKYI